MGPSAGVVSHGSGLVLGCWAVGWAGRTIVVQCWWGLVQGRLFSLPFSVSLLVWISMLPVGPIFSCCQGPVAVLKSIALLGHLCYLLGILCRG